MIDFKKIFENEVARISFFYLVLSLLMTYPLVLNLTTSVPGGGDAYSHMWTLWWYKHALFDLHENPFKTDYVTYPHTLDLGNLTHGLLPITMGIPLQMLFGTVAAYNLLLLMTFVLSGLGTYFLVKHLTKNADAAILAGLIFSFSPYHLAKGLGVLFLANVQWIPFFALFLVKTFENKKYDWKNPALAGIFFAATALSDWALMVFLAFFSAMYFAYLFVFPPAPIDKVFFKKTLLLAGISGLLVAPALYPVVSGALGGKTITAPIYETVDLSADLLGFFAPNPLSAITRDRFWTPDDFYSNSHFNTGEKTVYLGYTALALGFFGIVANQKKAFFWFSAALITFVIMLGPFLHVNGGYFWEFYGWTFAIPLPYHFLNDLPFFSYIHVPARFGAILMLCLAVLAGFGAASLLEKLGKQKKLKNAKRTTALAMFLLFTLLFVEYSPAPYPLANATASSFYHDLKKSTNSEILFEYPALTAETPEYNFYQTIHEKKIVWGHFQHNLNTPRLLAFVNDAPVFSSFTPSGENGILKIKTSNYTLAAKSILSYFKITQIVLHKRQLYLDPRSSYYKKAGKVNLSDFLRALSFAKNLSSKIAFEDDELVAFEIDRKKEPFVFPHFAENWSEAYPFKYYSNESGNYTLKNERYIPLNPASRRASLELLSTFENPISANISLESRTTCFGNCTEHVYFELNGNHVGNAVVANLTLEKTNFTGLVLLPGKNYFEVIAERHGGVQFKEILIAYD